MSAATELAPTVFIPEPARRVAPPARLATVTVLHRPSAPVAVPVRLTRRGVVVASIAVALAGLGLLALAWVSAPGSASAPTHAGPTPATVTVRAGDSLWSIATRVAPQRDPRAEVADLQRLNGLGTAALVPGQVLRVP